MDLLRQPESSADGSTSEEDCRFFGSYDVAHTDQEAAVPTGSSGDGDYFPSHLDCKRDVLLFPILCISQVPEDSHECVDGAVVFLPSCSVLAWSGGV